MEAFLLIIFIVAFNYKLGAFAMPRIIKWSIDKGYYAEVTWRSAHKTPTPSTGGLVFILALVTPLFFLQNLDQLIAFSMAYIALLTGWIDDRRDIKWYFKLGVQFGIGYVFYLLGFGIQDLHGIFWINEVEGIWSLGITILLVGGIINAINLIDGSDGLAGSISLPISIFFTIWFFATGAIFWGVYAATFSGLILSFLKYNYSPAKVFLGDTGSLFIGTNFSLFLLLFLNAGPSSYYLAPIALMLLPLLDMCKLFISRMASGKSPFSADKSHFHHLLMNLGTSHSSIAIWGLVSSLILGLISWILTATLNLNSACISLIGISVIIYVLISAKWYIYNLLKIKRFNNRIEELETNNYLLKSLNYED